MAYDDSERDRANYTKDVPRKKLLFPELLRPTTALCLGLKGSTNVCLRKFLKPSIVT
jgi:hypothetical protein